MTDEEIISGLVKFSEDVSKSKIEEEIGMPKNSLATILKGNKPLPPKHRQKMIDLLLKGFPPPQIDPEEIQRKIANAKANIPEHMKNLKLTSGDRIGAKKGQDGLYSYRGGILFQWRDGVEIQIPIPDKYKSQLERFSTPLFDPIEAIDELLVENKALKLKIRDMETEMLALRSLAHRPGGQVRDLTPGNNPDRRILNPNADRTKQMVEPEPGTPAWIMKYEIK